MKLAQIPDSSPAPRIRDTAAQDRVLDQAPVRRRRRWQVAAGIAAFVALAAIFAFSMRAWLSAETSVSRARLRLATVERGPFVRDVVVRGSVVAAVSPTLFAPAAGTVTLLRAAGDSVRTGEVLARLDSPGLRNELEQEQATLQELEIGLERRGIDKKIAELRNQQVTDLASVEVEAAARELRRAEQSHRQQVISIQDYEKAVDDLEKARLEHRHSLQNAALASESLGFEIRTLALQRDRQRLVVQNLERRVDELDIRAPVDGMIGTLAVEQKSVVAANAALLTVVDLEAFEIEVLVPETYADDLSLGMEAEISYGGATYPGILKAVSPEVRERQVRGRVRFAQREPEGLRQNQQVSVRVLLDSRPSALKVRRGPFVDSGGGRIAYVVEGNMAYRREIRLGAGSAGEMEILAGLDAGEQIVISDLAPFSGAQQVLLSD